MNKDVVLWVLTLGFFGGLGASARYINNLGREDSKFSFIRWLAEAFVGGVVAVFAGLLSKHTGMSEVMIYGVAGVVAISAKEIIHTLPEIIVGIIKKLASKIK